MRSAWFTSGFSKKYSKTINGYGKYAVQMSEALEGLTLNEDLRSGTFLYWRGVFDGKGTGLLHPKRRWCANCLTEDAEAQRPIVHKLLWTSFLVDHCPTHLTPLRSNCPSCGLEQLFVSDAVALGRCCHCGVFLGIREGLWDCPAPRPKEKFMVAAISEMIALGARAAELASIEKFVHQIKEFSLYGVDGPVPKLEREVGFRKGSIYRWTGLGKRPQFDQFMELCFRINLSPVQLLDGSWLSTATPWAIHKMEVPIRQHHKILSEAELAALREDVDRLGACDSSYEDAKDVAARHGITMNSFTNRYADIYAKFSQHRLHVRALLFEQRLRRQEEKTIEVVRNLHRSGARLVRAAIELRMREAGMTLKSPRLRAIAFAERTRLESDMSYRNSEFPEGALE
jgi:hypothetical protein